MKDEITTMLEEKIKSGIENLDNLPDGSQEKASAVDDLTTLYKLRIEEAKVEESRIEAENALVINEREEESKKAQMRHDRLMQFAKIGVDVGLGIAGFIFYSIWWGKGYRFEETGSYTSKTFSESRGRFKIPR